MLKWYAYCWRKYFVLSGRASRAEFWSFVFISVIVPFILFLIYFALGNAMREENALETTGQLMATESMASINGIYFTITSLWSVLNILPYLAVTVRRLHDRGHTGWWVFWSWIIPPLQLFILIFVLLGTDPMPNMYGVRPPKSPKDQVPNYYQNQAQMYMEFEKARQQNQPGSLPTGQPGFPQQPMPGPQQNVAQGQPPSGNVPPPQPPQA